MIKNVNVVGEMPQLAKAATISRVIRTDVRTIVDVMILPMRGL